MAKARVREALEGRTAAVRQGLADGWETFRESRLYVQSVSALLLVVLGTLAHLLPLGPLAWVDRQLGRALREDFDAKGHWVQVRDWADGRGGWRAAAGGLWSGGMDRFRDWIAPQRATQTDGVESPAFPQPGPQPVQPALGVQPADGGGAEASLPPLLPVDGDLLWEFGWLPQEVGEAFHEGIDLIAPVGSPVVAVQDGTVLAVRRDGRHGGVVEIRHGPVIAIYAQVEGVSVVAGERVRRGQQIGKVAQPVGIEQHLPPHLHFEIRPLDTGEPVNPAPFLGVGGRKL